MAEKRGERRNETKLLVRVFGSNGFKGAATESSESRLYPLQGGRSSVGFLRRLREGMAKRVTSKWTHWAAGEGPRVGNRVKVLFADKQYYEGTVSNPLILPCLPSSRSGSPVSEGVNRGGGRGGVRWSDQQGLAGAFSEFAATRVGV